MSRQKQALVSLHEPDLRLLACAGLVTAGLEAACRSGLASPMTGLDETAALHAASKAAGRLFRAYETHSTSPGPDPLFQTLTAIHSLNDKLRKAEVEDFEHLDEFVALKALRNFAHHQDEIEANVRVVPSPAVSDLAYLCLVRRDQVERAIEAVNQKWRAETRAACEHRFSLVRRGGEHQFLPFQLHGAC